MLRCPGITGTRVSRLPRRQLYKPVYLLESPLHQNGIIIYFLHHDYNLSEAFTTMLQKGDMCVMADLDMVERELQLRSRDLI